MNSEDIEVALLKTCKLVRKEACALYYARQSYSFERRETQDQHWALSQWIKQGKLEYAQDPRATLQAWLQKLGVERIKSVRSMEIKLKINSGFVAFRLTGDTLSAIVNINCADSHLDYQNSQAFYQEVVANNYEEIKSILETNMRGRFLQEPKSRAVVTRRYIH